jgi:hypothetical protein
MGTKGLEQIAVAVLEFESSNDDRHHTGSSVVGAVVMGSASSSPIVDFGGIPPSSRQTLWELGRERGALGWVRRRIFLKYFFLF